MIKTVQIIGPIASQYSFARVNRGLLFSLHQNHSELKVWAHNTIDRIDKYPDQEDFKTFPLLKKLWQPEKIQSDVVIYNDYPKSGHTLHGIKDLPGRIKIVYLAWEESVYPEFWVNEINEHAHAVFATSHYVKKIFEDSGIRIPIFVVHCGLEQSLLDATPSEFSFRTKKKFKFFNIGTGKKRKGIDVLIKAYFSKFTKNDDVCLVIKSSFGPDNNIDELIASLQTENSPEIEHICNSSLSESEMASLVYSCDVAVYPTRAEGFGLPLIEAMYAKKPLIATNYSAHLDFANETNSWLIDFKKEFSVDSEHVNIGAKWAEPNVEHLADTMFSLYQTYLNQNPEETKHREEKVNLAFVVAKQVNWKNSADTLVKLLPKVQNLDKLKKQNLGIISPWNSQDGIAEYSKDLHMATSSSFNQMFVYSQIDITDRNLPDEDFVRRTWNAGESTFMETISQIQKDKIDIIHIQYHSGFHFPLESLDLLIKNLNDLGIEVYVTLHQVKAGKIVYAQHLHNLHLAKKVYIHNKQEATALSNTFANVEYFPSPRHNPQDIDSTELKKYLGLQNHYPIILTHGMLTIKNNILEQLLAFKKIKDKYPNALFIMANAVTANNANSQTELQVAISTIQKLGLKDSVLVETNFLSDKEVYAYMALADVLSIPYIDVGESGSGVVGKMLASKKPILTTNIPQFSEFTNEVYKIESSDSRSIATGLEFLLTNKPFCNQMLQHAKIYLREKGYNISAAKILQDYSNK